MGNWLIPIRVKHTRYGTPYDAITYRTLYIFFIPVARWSTVRFND